MNPRLRHFSFFALAAALTAFSRAGTNTGSRIPGTLSADADASGSCGRRDRFAGGAADFAACGY